MTTPAAAAKENASSGSLKQSTLQMGGSRLKRTLAMSNGEHLDLTSKISKATPEVVEAMRLRILQLEDELNTQGPPAKRAKTTATASEPAAEAGPSKADEKKRKIHVKKIFDQLKKECKSNDVKFQGSAKTIKVDEVFEAAEFDALFAGKGHLIQPTPENKPKSTVTIIQFANQAHISSFFGDELKPLKGFIWSRGGSGTRSYGGAFGFGGGGGFAKSIKQGACDVAIRFFEVNYSKNSLKCTIKFEVTQVGGNANYYGDESDY